MIDLIVIIIIFSACMWAGKIIGKEFNSMPMGLIAGMALMVIAGIFIFYNFII